MKNEKFRNELQNALEQIDDELNEEVIAQRLKNAGETPKRAKTLRFRVLLVAAVVALVVAAVMIPLAVMMNRTSTPIDPNASETITTSNDTTSSSKFYQTEKYVTDEYNSSDTIENNLLGAVGDSAATIISPWHFAKEDSSAPKSVTVAFQGVDYSGEYSCSLENIHRYDSYSSYGGLQYSILIDRHTGEFRGIEFSTGYRVYEKPATAEQIEYGKTLAQRIASSYVQLDKYALTVTEFNEVNTDYGTRYKVPMLTFTFNRIVDGTKTNDSVTVTMWFDGTLVNVYLCNVGRYEDLEKAPEIDENKLNKSIAAYMNEYLESIDHECAYSVSDRYLAASSDGRLAIVSVIEIHLNNGTVKHLMIFTEV